MHHNVFDFAMVGVYVLLVITFSTISVLFVRERVRLRPIDRRVARVASVLFLVTLAAALDSLYWALAQSGRIGFLPPSLGRLLYQSRYIFVSKTGMLLSGFVLWYYLRRREIPELHKESEEGRQIRILHEITDSTTRSLDLSTMLESAVPRMLELIQMEYAAVYIRGRSDELDLVAAFGHSESPYSPIWQDVRGQVVSDAAHADVPTLQEPVGTGNGKARSSTTVYIPLLSREHNSGVLVLSSESPRVFTQKDMDLLLAVGSQLAVSIENAILFRENQQLLAEANKSAKGLAEKVEERTQMLEEAQEQLGMAEIHKRQFYKDTVLAVTGGKLLIVEPEELPEIGLQPTEVCELAHKEDIGVVRRVIKQIAMDAGMSKSRVDNLLLATGEATTNAVKHGAAGIVRIYRPGDVIQVAIEDQGPGIDALTLPRATLLKGYSTKPSLGMGYALILELADKVYLSTGPNGTIVVIEMTIKEPPTELTLDIIPDTWSQF